MGRLIASLIASLWLMYIGIMYESESILLLAFGIIVFIILSLVDLVIRYVAVSAKIVIPLNVAEVGSNVNVQIQVRNKSLFAIAKTRYEIVTRNLFLKDSCKHKVYGDIVIPGNNTLCYGIAPKEPGNYEVGIKGVYIYNLTGTFYVKKKIKKSAYLQVNPSLTSIGIGLTEATKNFYGEGDVYNDLRPGNDPSETFQIREFRNGDKLQKIHWKLSAKMDDLVVKEDSEPKSAPVVLFLDYAVPASKKEDAVDAYLGMLGSISFSMLDVSCYHYIAWYSVKRKDIVRVRICDEESFFFVLAAYLSDSYEKSPEPLADLYERKYRGEHYLYAFYLNEKLEIIKNKALICKCSKDNWKRELEGLEIII